MTMTIPQVTMTIDFPCKNHHEFLYVWKSQVFMIVFNQYLLFNNTNNHNITHDYEHEYFLNHNHSMSNKKYIKQNKHKI